MWVLAWTVGGKCSERFVGRLVSTPMHGFEVWTVKSPSIGSRISTCWWIVGPRMSTHSGSTRCGLMDPDGIVGVPTMLDEV